MKWIEKQTGNADKVTDRDAHLDADAGDAVFQEAVEDFKRSMDAWSEAAFHRPRTIAVQVKRRSWQLAAGWSLGCMLVAGSASGVMYERHQRQNAERLAAAQLAAEQQRQRIELQTHSGESDEVLLAGVDSDVSRQVPSAMEPLAQLMDDTK